MARFRKPKRRGSVVEVGLKRSRDHCDGGASGLEASEPADHPYGNDGHGETESAASMGAAVIESSSEVDKGATTEGSDARDKDRATEKDDDYVVQNPRKRRRTRASHTSATGKSCEAGEVSGAKPAAKRLRKQPTAAEEQALVQWFQVCRSERVILQNKDITELGRLMFNIDIAPCRVTKLLQANRNALLRGMPADDVAETMRECLVRDSQLLQAMRKESLAKKKCRDWLLAAGLLKVDSK